MKTLLTIKQQHQFLSDNWQLKTLIHKWSCRGYGNSKIIDGRDNVIGKAGGCGYDRYGAALGNAISAMFPEEVLRLAQRECKGRRRTYKQAKTFYGLFYNSIDKKAWLDGACGSGCMDEILKKIGFSLEQVAAFDRGQTGETVYVLKPITKHDRKWLK